MLTQTFGFDKIRIQSKQLYMKVGTVIVSNAKPI
jgi:hypothetical protein